MFEVEARKNVVVLHGVSWATYLRLDEDRGDRRWPKLTYLDGELEIVSPTGRVHEQTKWLITRFVEAYAAVNGLRFNSVGSMTLRDRRCTAGAEPDEGYYVGRKDFRRKPDLAIEVTVTSGGVHKLAAYHRLGVREVWFWKAGALSIYERRARSFALLPQSGLFPELDLEDLAARVRTASLDDQIASVEAYRAWLQR
jgi:Uma2 family endonuclease